jgi:hypothetical protein
MFRVNLESVLLSGRTHDFDFRPPKQKERNDKFSSRVCRIAKVIISSLFVPVSYFVVLMFGRKWLQEIQL